MTTTLNVAQRGVSWQSPWQMLRLQSNPTKLSVFNLRVYDKIACAKQYEKKLQNSEKCDKGQEKRREKGKQNVEK